MAGKVACAFLAALVVFALGLFGLGLGSSLDGALAVGEEVTAFELCRSATADEPATAFELCRCRDRYVSTVAGVELAPATAFELCRSDTVDASATAFELCRCRDR